MTNQERASAPAGLCAGKTVLVTGGASGIGQATALLFAREGARVAVADLSLSGAETVVAAIAQAGGEAIAIHADVASEADVAAMVAKAVEHFGHLDCAFNNAGITSAASGEGGLGLCDVSEKGWNLVLGVNLTGVFLCLKHEIRHMRERGGSIVNTASIGGHIGLPGSCAYTATKHGVIGLTKVAAIEYASSGVRVNAVCPGYIDTPLLTPVVTPERRRRLEQRAPMQRLGEAHEIAELVVWLCSDRASFVTGSAYAADGGFLAG
jgi:NAD(P)-dependent dehydrogenase (short-subunit alcohol dehydrogenase family)